MIRRTRTVLSLLAVTVVSVAAAPTPGGPIGGIIVKGGKNPGGQMLVLDTSDTKGKFSIAFAEGGEYRVEFSGKAPSTVGERQPADVRLEYVMKANDARVARSQATDSGVRGTARFASSLRTAQLLVKVPNGGAEISGALYASVVIDVVAPAERAINESGVSVKSPKAKPKGS
ncbi:hypothetical protein [Gemmatimonas sp.]|uniref:hypothetical protein n=1 Tax=Gemmatimonas sp. TaxID=1962908 RepID=UPI00398366AD